MDVCSQNSDCGQNACIHVGDRDTWLDWLAAFFTSNTDEAAERLENQVEPAFTGQRAFASVSCNRTVDESRVHLFEDVVAQPEPLHHAKSKVLRENVCLRDHAQQSSFSLGRLEIDADGPLAAVQHHERWGEPTIAFSAVVSRIVARREFLDLVDLGSHVGKHQTTRWTSHNLRQLQHFHAMQRPFELLVSCVHLQSFLSFCLGAFFVGSQAMRPV
ncbi:hypothetical protein D3C87_892730 [compost metagenome]